MKVVLVITVLIVACVAEDRMRIIPLTIEPFSGAVHFPADVKGDQAVVQVFYRTNKMLEGNSQPVHLLLSKQFVIPIIAGATVAFNEVPAGRDQVSRIEVTLLSNVDHYTFAAPPAEEKVKAHELPRR